ncbi:MAG: response regulator transcription factor [Candidatus Limivicinus sp.]|nr:response regulator transcription factor [Candidatus Limivicinus sp.]
MRILVVEDEKHLNRIISEAVEDEGYSVDSCYNGLEALEYLECADYDVIILDIMMPKMNGLELVRRLRDRGDSTPVLFLTARDAVADRVEGLESGGDYYLTKPFDFQELMAVVRVMTRKYTGNRSNVYTIADLSLDSNTRTVTRAGKNIELTAKEFSLLEYMMRNKGVVLSREMIENNLWNYDYEGGTNVVDVYVGYLRKKMDTGFSRKLIHTVWGTGWVLKES